LRPAVAWLCSSSSSSLASAITRASRTKQSRREHSLCGCDGGPNTFAMTTYNLSPTLEPAYSCGTSISILDIGDDAAFISTLNPSASEFVPSFYAIADDSKEANLVDDILHSMHHLVSVYDSDMLRRAEQFAEAEVPLDDVAHLLDQEDSMLGTVHVAAQKPKGNTYGRKRSSRDRRR